MAANPVCAKAETLWLAPSRAQIASKTGANSRGGNVVFRSFQQDLTCILVFRRPFFRRPESLSIFNNFCIFLFLKWHLPRWKFSQGIQSCCGFQLDFAAFQTKIHFENQMSAALKRNAVLRLCRPHSRRSVCRWFHDLRLCRCRGCSASSVRIFRRCRLAKFSALTRSVTCSVGVWGGKLSITARRSGLLRKLTAKTSPTIPPPIMTRS